MTVIVIRNAEVLGESGLDLKVRRGRITEIGHAVSTSQADEVIDAHGGAVIPGLHDHHIHLHATASAAASVQCGPPTVQNRAGLAAALSTAAGDEHGWIRGVGYFESVAGDLDALAIDALHARRPVRIQHRSGALWILNSVALQRINLADAAHPGVELDAAGSPTGRIWRADAWLRNRLPHAIPPELSDLGLAMARLGITGITDATPDLSASSQAALTRAVTMGTLPQRLHLLGAPLDAVAPTADPRISFGPYKIVIADSNLPSLESLVGRIRTAHRYGRAVAVHCVTRESLLLLMAALNDTGTLRGDRIEHGALIPADSIPELNRLGLTVVTQPGFLHRRGDDYLREVADADLPDLYRCRSLVDAGVPLALSSDAPYGPIDPWIVIKAAVNRATSNGFIANTAERLSHEQALRAYLGAPDDPGGRPRRIEVGMPADLVVLKAPLAWALQKPTADNVRATIINGRLF